MNGRPFDRLRANEKSKTRRKRKTLGWLWPELTLMGVESKIRVAQYYDKGANHVCTEIEHEAL